MGNSGGAVITSYIQLMPEYHGLFNRAIFQSGSAAMMLATFPELEGQLVFDHLCMTFKIPSDLSPLEKVSRLRDIPAKDIAEEMNTTPVVNFRPTIDGVLIKEDSYIAVSNPSNYDPNFEWVMTGTVPDEGVSKLKDFPAFKDRHCAPCDSEMFDRIYGVPVSDKETSDISAEVISRTLIQYPVHRVNVGIMSHPKCQLGRFYSDRKLEYIDALAPTLGAHHGFDMFFTFGNDHAKKYMTKDEILFIREVQGVWIEFATALSPEASTLPKVKQGRIAGAIP
ncbi:hypothetical protein BGX26_005403 [Mortierella sp. AD094]|nr:hypothetical protein BGX26_005403 [Mortierella sp. AD094]